jgi:hypothetical protein
MTIRLAQKNEGIAMPSISSSAGTASSSPATSSFPIKNPRPLDVKCGQDKTFEKHHGNVVLRNKIFSLVPTYKTMKNMTSKAGKKKQATSIIRGIVNAMKAEHGSRFIRFKTDGNYWEEITPSLARDKVSHAIRTVIRKEEKKSRAAPKYSGINDFASLSYTTTPVNHFVVTPPIKLRRTLTAGTVHNVALDNINTNSKLINGLFGDGEITEYSKIAIASTCSTSSQGPPFTQGNQVTVVTPPINPREIFNCSNFINEQSIPVASMDNCCGNDTINHDVSSTCRHNENDFDFEQCNFTQAMHSGTATTSVPSQGIDNQFDLQPIRLDDFEYNIDYLNSWTPDDFGDFDVYDVNDEFNNGLDRLLNEY